MTSRTRKATGSTIAKRFTRNRPGMVAFTARKLQSQNFPPVKYAVEGYFPEGLVLLGGKPKIGKSWLALDISVAVATGRFALGAVPCKKGPVLYAALEDNQRRLQRRMRQIYGDEEKWPRNLHFATQMRRWDEGGLDDVRDWIFDNKPALVIFDTLACVRPKRKIGGTGYEDDYAALAPLQELAGETGVCVVVIHHLRKMSGDDPLDTISGTTGLTGAVDTIMVLNRDTGGLSLYGRGREIEEFEIALEQNNGIWKILGPTSEVRRSDQRKAIFEVLKNGDDPMSLKEISKALSEPANNVKQLLYKMAKAGELDKPARGKYCVPQNCDVR